MVPENQVGPTTATDKQANPIVAWNPVQDKSASKHVKNASAIPLGDHHQSLPMWDERV